MWVLRQKAIDMYLAADNPNLRVFARDERNAISFPSKEEAEAHLQSYPGSWDDYEVEEIPDA